MSAEASEKGNIYDIFCKYLDIKDNKAPGWNHVKQGHYKDSGLSWVLWQNQVQTNTYCLVYAGTDQILDTLSYLPTMVKEGYCDQMKQAIEVARNIKNYAKTTINKLFVVGHSLGGYLASYVVSDMVDSTIDTSKAYSQIKVQEVSSSLSLSNVRCYTFGAPGIYYNPIKILGIKYDLTSWGKAKKTNNENKKYDKYIYNYTNKYDPVGHLFISPKSFKHLGNVKDYDVKRISAKKTNDFSMFVKKQGIIGKLYNIANTFIPVSEVYYHLPHVYINVM